MNCPENPGVLIGHARMIHKGRTSYASRFRLQNPPWHASKSWKSLLYGPAQLALPGRHPPPNKQVTTAFLVLHRYSFRETTAETGLNECGSAPLMGWGVVLAEAPSPSSWDCWRRRGLPPPRRTRRRCSGTLATPISPVSPAENQHQALQESCKVSKKVPSWVISLWAPTMLKKMPWKTEAVYAKSRV